MKLKALALCAALGGSIVAHALPAQSATPRQHYDPEPTGHYADAIGNTDGYRSGSDNANNAG